MAYKKVVVAGGGVLGSQIAFQSAYCGFDVTIWLRSESSIGRTQPKIDKLKDSCNRSNVTRHQSMVRWHCGFRSFR